MVEIELTKGQIALVDSADVELLNKYSWYSWTTNGKTYAVRDVRHKNGKRELVLMHRFILGLLNSKEQCDHIDGNGLNNTRDNLRKCNQAQNNRNIGIPRHNTTGFKGITALKGGKYTAHVRYQRKLIHLGYFNNAISAAKAYDEAAIEYHGEFARTNEMLGLIK